MLVPVSTAVDAPESVTFRAALKGAPMTKTFDQMPENLTPVVASAASPGEYFESVMDVSAAPLYVPAKRLQATLANQQFPLARSAVFESLTRWDEVAAFLEDGADLTISFEAESGRSRSLFASNDDVAMAVELGRWGEWTITVAAVDRATATKWIDAMAALLPSPPPPPPPEPLPYNVLPVRFWMESPHGDAMSRRRNITVTEWSDVQANYSSKVRSDLANLANMRDATAGKLILLHGEPGTGKSRLIMSLMSEWRDWCSASVVTDTDRFFGNASYVNSLVFNSDGMKDWMMLVLEDSDEFIAVGSKANKGQAISRLLNLADGIVGQGLNLLLVMTTNVAVDELNPAIVRPGRCLANINVGPLPVVEANAWLAEKGSTATVEEDSTLATLYAALAAT